MNLKKALTWAGIAIVAYFLISKPAHAGNLVNNGFENVQLAADRILLFFQKITG